MSITVNDESFAEEVIGCSDFILVDFWAPWCGPCNALTPHVEKLAEERAIKTKDHEKVKVCKLNIDDAQNTAVSYNVRSIPTLIIFKDGKEIARKIGGCDFNSLTEWIDSEIEKNK